jgi:hypothetical protein
MNSFVKVTDGFCQSDHSICKRSESNGMHGMVLANLREGALI